MAVLMSSSTILGTCPAPIFATASNDVATEVEVTSEATSVDANAYGLASVNDGNILHAWDWKFTEVTNNIEDIAKAGYSVVQVSPCQACEGFTSNNDWWKSYQPYDYAFGSAYGTEEEFKTMCATAKEYGVSIIVDVIANHIASQGKSGGYALKDGVPSFWKDNSSYFHGTGKEFGTDDNGDKDRSAMVNNNVGLADVNTNNADVQARFLDYMKQLLADGASGFRFDTAKHIGTSEDSGDAQDSFWKNTVGKIRQEYGDSILIYGEILNKFEFSGGASAMKYYVNEGIKVTESQIGWMFKDGIQKKQLSSASDIFTYDRTSTNNISSDNLITWVENHDTYLNDWGMTGTDTNNPYGDYNYMTNEGIVVAWAALASRADTQSLFFARPNSISYTGGSMVVNGSLGMSTTDKTWKDPTVAAVNNFKNAMVGENENCSTNGNLAIVKRGTKGVVIANFGSNSGNFDVSGLSGLADGTYEDATGNNGSFTVSGGKVSGSVKGRSVVVLYDKNATPVATPEVTKEPEKTVEPTVTPEEGAAQISVSKDSSEFEKAFDVTVEVKDAQYAYYSYDGADWTEVKDGKATVTIGADAKEVGDEFALYVKAKGKDGKTVDVEKTYTFAVTTTETITTTAQPATTGLKIRIPKSEVDFTPSVYFFEGSTTIGAKWPGTAMTLEGDYYVFADESMTGSYTAIFNDGKSENNTWQDPQKDKGGYTVSGYMEYSKSKASVSEVTEGGKDVTTTTSVPATVSPNAKKAGKAPEFTEPGTATSTPEETVGPTPEGTAGPTPEVTEEPIVASPYVEVSVPDQSEFDTDTMDVTLTLKDATKGTYTIDGGVTKTFVDGETVTIGEGKIADTEVTLKVTATDGNKDYEQTYTYKKVFNPGKEAESQNVTVATSAVKKIQSLFEVVADAAEVNAASNDSLASQYGTNTVGIGTKKTISVDKSIDDWDSSMLIAQGAANDDPRVYRENSMYEVGIDMYALYGAYDDNNLYLMWEMTNVQDVVAPNDNYPLTQGTLYENMNCPFFIAVDTGNSDAIGNNGNLQTTGTLWDNRISITNSFNRMVVASYNGANGPYVYGGDSSGLNPVEIYGPQANAKTGAQATGVKLGYGKGILSKEVVGIDKAYGAYNDRVVGDVCNDGAAWVDFNTLGHDSATMDFHFEISIPLSELGISASDVQNNGVGVYIAATMGMSAMDCLPYDVSMNDNADLPDTESQEFNSYEKSDEDLVTTSFARIGNGTINPARTPNVTKTAEPDETPAVEETPAVDETPAAEETPVADVTATPEVTVAPATEEPQETVAPATEEPQETVAPATEAPTAEPIKVEVTSTEQMVVNFGANLSAPQEAGTALTLEAKPMNTTGTCQYQFAIDGELVQGYSENATYQWNTTSGKHTIQVAVKDENGNTVSVTKNYTVEGDVVATEAPATTAGVVTVPTTVPTTAPIDNGNVPGAVTQAAMTAELKFSPATSVAVNKKVTITPVIANYKTSYTYSIVAKKNDGTVKAIATDSTAASVTWKPTAKGTYTITINAKDAEGNLATKSYTYKVTKLALTAKANKKAIKRGKKIKFTAKASSVTGTAKYRFVIKKGAKKIATVKYGKKKTYTWKAKKSLKVGTYKCMISVKDGSGTVVTKTVKFKVKK